MIPRKLGLAALLSGCIVFAACASEGEIPFIHTDLQKKEASGGGSGTGEFGGSGGGPSGSGGAENGGSGGTSEVHSCISLCIAAYRESWYWFNNIVGPCLCDACYSECESTFCGPVVEEPSVECGDCVLKASSNECEASTMECFDSVSCEDFAYCLSGCW